MGFRLLSCEVLHKLSIKMESGSTTDKVGGTTNFRCVQCGFPIGRLYIQYSPGNIRLMKCVNCKAVADEYIECEVMIIIIDLILHKPKVYRHLFYNLLSMGKVNFESFLWKSLLAYLALDIYRVWVLSTNETEKPLPTGVAPLLQEFGKMLTGAIIGNLGLHCILYIAARKFLSVSAVFFRWKQILLVILVSSYFKFFLTAMMVWEFPSSVVYIVDIFVLSSNIVALKAITNSETAKCLAICAVAHGVKYLVQNNMLFT